MSALCAFELVSRLVVPLSFFFFQAEDGIRDGHVTGVQTGALPISSMREALAPFAKGDSVPLPGAIWIVTARSEERRVGKECRCGWSRARQKKKAETRREAAGVARYRAARQTVRAPRGTTSTTFVES